MQDLFLQAHATAHPEGAAIAELHAAGISPSRITSLYPYDLADWAAAIIEALRAFQPAPEATGKPDAKQTLQVELGSPSIKARLLGIEETLRFLDPRASVAWRADVEKRASAVLFKPKNEELLWALHIWESGEDGTGLNTSTFLAANEVLAIASQWSALPELHAERATYAMLLEASLAALLPTHFRMQFPPLTSDPWRR